jgi:TadE-like protein
LGVARVSSARDGLVRDQRGAVFVEFIISFIPMFIFFLGITQLAFSYATKIVVQHAAYKAVRAAIVSEPETKRDCKNGSGDDSGEESEAQGFNGLQNPFSESPSPDAQGKGEPSEGSPLVKKVRAAAYLPLSTLAPPSFAYPAVGGALASIGEGLGQYTARFASGYFIYNRSHAGVTFRDSEGNVIEPKKLEAGPVTIHISYLHYCMIPLVSRFMCNPLYDLGGLRREIAWVFSSVSDLKDINFQDTIDSKGANITQAADNLQGASERIQERIEYTKKVYGELLNAELPGMLLLWADPAYHFQMIQAEATLPFQFASYVDQCQDAK